MAQFPKKCQDRNRPCVLPKLHGLSCAFDYKCCTGMEIMEQVAKFNISNIMAKKQTLKYILGALHTIECKHGKLISTFSCIW